MTEQNNSQKPKLWILKGLPGSGKSTRANEIVKEFPNTCHFEADMYFMDGDEYKFDPTKLAQAHSWCLNSAFRAMYEGKNVVVSNTFTTLRESRPYIDKATECGYEVEVIVMKGNFKSVHNVPDHVIERMRERFQH